MLQITKREPEVQAIISMHLLFLGLATKGLVASLGSPGPAALMARTLY